MVILHLACAGKLGLFPTSLFQDLGGGGQRWSWEASEDHCHYSDKLPTAASVHALVQT
jgi:hypothetical protein